MNEEITLDFSGIPNRPIPEKDVFDVAAKPEYGYDSKSNNGQFFDFIPKEELIQTPSFSKAKTPQPHILKEAPEDISEILHLHQRLEVLEHRIRFNKEEYPYETDQVAELYTIMHNFEIQRNELFFLETYNLPPNKNEIPNFWPSRVYDREDERISDEASEKMRNKIEATKKIVMVERQERTDWREMKRLMKIVENAEGHVLMAERRKKGSLFDPNPPPNAGFVRRKLEPSHYILKWDNENLMTESSSDETDVEDFSLPY